MINRFVNCKVTVLCIYVCCRYLSPGWELNYYYRSVEGTPGPPTKILRTQPSGSPPLSPSSLSLTRTRFWVSVSFYVYRPDWRRLPRTNHERYGTTIFLRLKTISWRVSSRCKSGGGGKMGFLQLVSDRLGCFLHRSCTACRQFIHETSSQAVGIIRYTGLRLALLAAEVGVFFTFCA